MVGIYKTHQYEDVLLDLDTIEKPLPNEGIGILSQIQKKKGEQKKISKHRNKALGRIDLYSLVIFGGKIMLAVGSVLAAIGLSLKLERKRA